MIVSACEACNNKKSKVDQCLRDFLVADAWGSQSPIALDILETKAARSLFSGRSRILENLVSSAELKTLTTKGGIVLGEFYEAKLESNEIEEALAYIVRGLHFRVKGSVLGRESTIEIQRHLPESWAMIDEMFSKLGNHEVNHVGDIFTARYSYARGQDEISFWQLVFYSRVVFTAFVKSPIVSE